MGMAECGRHLAVSDRNQPTASKGADTKWLACHLLVLQLGLHPKLYFSGEVPTFVATHGLRADAEKYTSSTWFVTLMDQSERRRGCARSCRDIWHNSWFER